MLDKPFVKKFVLISNLNLTWHDLDPCSVTCYMGEEPDPCLATTSFQGVLGNDKVTLDPPFLQAKYPHLPQLLLIRLVSQTLHQLLFSGYIPAPQCLSFSEGS